MGTVMMLSQPLCARHARTQARSSAMLASGRCQAGLVMREDLAAPFDWGIDAGVPLSKVYQLLEPVPVVLLATARTSWPCPGT